MNFLKDNPFHERKIYYPKIEKPKLNVYDDEEANDFFNEIQNEDPKIKALLLCALMLGIRRAELIGLKWSDIDFKKKRVYIYESAYKVVGEEQNLKDTKMLAEIKSKVDALQEAYDRKYGEKATEKEQISVDLNEPVNTEVKQPEAEAIQAPTKNVEL